MGNIINNEHSVFEEIKQIEDDIEYWSSRDLSKILGYTDYRNFKHVIDKAKKACENSGQEIMDHFVDVNDMVDIGSGAKRALESTKLSRYACYLIIQNADPNKESVALGQSYFAIQTRKQELYEQSSEDEKRIMLRNEMKKHNNALAEAASNAGVVTPKEFAIFQNHGYKGLYGGWLRQTFTVIKA